MQFNDPNNCEDQPDNSEGIYVKFYTLLPSLITKSYTLFVYRRARSSDGDK